jgi:sec-independent protein translocase protein TatA
MPSGPEWIIVLVVVLVIFGGSQLPKLAKNLGKAQKEFKDGLAEGQAEKVPEENKEADLAAQLEAAKAEAAQLRAQAAARTDSPAPTAATEPKTD